MLNSVVQRDDLGLSDVDGGREEAGFGHDPAVQEVQPRPVLAPADLEPAEGGGVQGDQRLLADRGKLEGQGGNAREEGPPVPPAARLVDVEGCILVSSGRPIGAVGLRGLVVVEGPGGVLVCPRDRAQEVRRVAEGG